MHVWALEFSLSMSFTVVHFEFPRFFKVVQGTPTGIDDESHIQCLAEKNSLLGAVLFSHTAFHFLIISIKALPTKPHQLLLSPSIKNCLHMCNLHVHTEFTNKFRPWRRQYANLFFACGCLVVAYWTWYSVESGLILNIRTMYLVRVKYDTMLD